MLPDLLLRLYIVIAVALALFGGHMGFLLWTGRRMRMGAPAAKTVKAPTIHPQVTVQLPLYNERHVAERGIRAAAALAWPRERLQIQVLDDSTDETTSIARKVVEELHAAGHNIVLLHRKNREGFKAGALAAAMPSATGEFIAMFDADFTPQPNFLHALLIERDTFADPRIGFVQARWSYTNRDQNLMTRVQAVMHDPHFFVEQPVRAGQGWALNFNGAGGIWRRAAIDDAGGWSSDTLTEDLDLSFRAYFKGWRGAYAGDVVAPNELPEDILSFKRQQARWARGSLQCARKLLPVVWRSPQFSLGGRLISTMHLLGYTLHLCLLGFILLWPICQLMPRWVPGAEGFPDWLLWLAPSGLVYPLAMILIQLVQRRPWWRVAIEFPLAGWLGVGLGFANSVAVLQGIFRKDTGVFLRTPKSGTERSPVRRSYRVRTDWTMGVEALIVVALVALGIEMWAKDFGLWSVGPFFYGSGYVMILALQVKELLARQSGGARVAPLAPLSSPLASGAED